MNEETIQLKKRICELETKFRRQWYVVAFTLLATLVIMISTFAKQGPRYIRVAGIAVVDAQGKDRILIGSYPSSSNRLRKDTPTMALVVLGPNGEDRVILGEAPDPILAGKKYKRIAASYGMTIHDKTGQERGGMSFLDNGRGVVALDRKNQDAVEMIVNDATGFAGITMNYEKPLGQYREAARFGTKGNEVWLELSDTSELARASLRVKGHLAPKLSLLPAN